MRFARLSFIVASLISCIASGCSLVSIENKRSRSPNEPTAYRFVPIPKANLRRDPRPRDFVEALLKLMNAARIHDAEAKCEDWVRELSKHDASPTWAQVRSTMLALFKS